MFLPTLALLVSPVHAPVGACAIDPATATAVTATVPADSALLAHYREGITWEAFLSSARARRAAWVANWGASQVPPDALAAARELPGRWRLLVIAVDSCSDSVNTIPYLARLVEEVPSLEMRIVSPRAGRPLMATRTTPDGRAATPTVILLDADGVEAGCWIERPAGLQRLAIAAGAGGGTPEFAAAKQGWYDADAGASTVREVVALLVKAAGGTRGCDAGPVSSGL